MRRFLPLLLVLLLGLALLAWYLPGWFAEQTILDSALTAEGHITARNVSRECPQGVDAQTAACPQRYYVTYEFTINGTTYWRRAEVVEAAYPALTVDAPVTVRYLSDAPDALSRIPGEAPGAPFPLALALLWGALLAGAGLWALYVRR